MNLCKMNIVSNAVAFLKCIRKFTLAFNGHDHGRTLCTMKTVQINLVSFVEVILITHW